MSVEQMLQRALALHRGGQQEEAARMYRQVLQAEPRNASALHLLGVILLERRAFAEAERHLRLAVDLVPASAVVRLNHAKALRGAGRLGEAERAVRIALTTDPAFADAHQLLGNLLKAQRRHQEALVSLREAVRLAPAEAAAWLNLGVAALESNQLDDSLAAFEKALSLEPGRPEALNIHGHALLTAGRAMDARARFEEALRLSPVYAPAHDNLGRLLRMLGHPTEASASFDKAVECGAGAGTQSNRLYALNFDPSVAPEAVAAQHREWGRSFPLAPIRSASGPDRRLKVGFVSADLVHHAVSYFFEIILEHPPADWEIHCYFNGTAGDAVTGRLRSRAQHWISVVDLSDEALFTRITRDGIDVLFDLHGHTAQNRLPAFARRCAPVQVTWLGYPNTTGLREMDYRVTDRISDPTEARDGLTSDGLHSERLLRLPGPFLCYRPPEDSPEVSPAPSLKHPGVTFGSFNHSAKVNGEVVAVWSRILHACASSRLFLRAHVLADPRVADDFRRRFAQHGIAADRLLLSGAKLSVHDHLAAYSQVDIALDPFPYNGTTTTCEALWMGVPVITLAGRNHAARVGASLLTHLGRREWIADSPDQYVRLAGSLAGTPDDLATLRQELRAEMAASPLCAGPEFSRALSAAIRGVWVNACRASSNSAGAGDV